MIGIELSPGSNFCSRLKVCSHLCFSVPGSYSCACPDNMRNVTSVSGNVTCECQPGEHMDANGECKTRSEYSSVISIVTTGNLNLYLAIEETKNVLFSVVILFNGVKFSTA